MSAATKDGWTTTRMQIHGKTVIVTENTPSDEALKATNRIINQIAKRHYAK